MMDSTAQTPQARGQTNPYWAAALVSISAALLFMGYELVRSPANTLFKSVYGKEGLPYAMAATPVGVVLILYIYGRLLSWVGPRRTMIITTIGCCAILAGSYAGIALKVKIAAGVLYVMRDAYIVLLMEQYWSFLNSTLGDSHARKLNGPICGVGSCGSVLGAALVGSLAEKVGTASLLLMGSAITLPTVIFMYLAYRKCGEPRPHTAEKRSDTLGVKLFGTQPLLAVLLAVILLSQAIAGLTDLAFQGILQDKIPQTDAQTAFSGWYFMWMNILAGVMQFVATPLLLWLVPIRLTHLIIPLLHVGACLYLWGSPTLFSAGLAYMLFKVIDYSVFRGAKELLYIPLSFDCRYRAKELIDVFGYRFGKGGMSLLIVFLQGAKVTLADPTMGLMAAGAAAVWAVLTIPLGKGYAAATSTAAAHSGAAAS